MDNITTLPTTPKTLSVGEVIWPTTAPWSYTVLAASVKYPKSNGTYTGWIALLVHLEKRTPFTTHIVIDTPEGWACESGCYFDDLSDALANFIERGGEVG